MKKQEPNRDTSGIAPLLLSEAAAAAILDESEQTRRIRRYEDQKRLERGETIQGPAWIRDGKKRIKYRFTDLQSYAAKVPNCLDLGAGGSNEKAVA